MENTIKQENKKTPTVAIFSDANLLALKILETFLSNLVKVKIFTDDTKGWSEKTSYLVNKLNYEILDTKSFKQFNDIRHVVFCCGFRGKDDPYKIFRQIHNKEYLAYSKVFLVMPFERFDSNENNLLPLNSNLGVCYVGDLLGLNFDLDSILRINRAFQEALSEGSITYDIGQVYYPTNPASVSKKIFEWIFSFGPFGKESFLIGGQVSGTTLWKEMSKYIQDLRLFTQDEGLPRIIPRTVEKTVFNDSFPKLIRDTVSWLNISKPKKTHVYKPIIKIQVKKININYKYFLLAFAFLLPYFLSLISGSLFFIAYKLTLKGNMSTSRNILLLSKAPTTLNKVITSGLIYIPMVNKLYINIHLLNILMDTGVDIGVDALYMADSAKGLTEGVLGDRVYDPSFFTKTLSARMDRANRNIKGLFNKTNKNIYKNTYVYQTISNSLDFERLIQVTNEAPAIISELPNFLGKDGKKTYLILFQNNMELRPTGGFIGSFGLLTMEGGRMVDLSVSDVYSADGQLKGHIEPPKPIKDYLGEAGWFLRDSNWDPDFSTSAKRAEWFLSKEIDKQVDGVIALDLEPVKDLLKITGPTYLADYGMEVTDKNVYEKSQSEVQENFFAGSTKKASFLTSLSRVLINTVIETNSIDKSLLSKLVIENLEKRHIQVYVHNNDMQLGLSNLNWSGDVYVPKCNENSSCYADVVGVIEANMGVNKANYFIKRTISVNVKVDKNEIQRQMVLNIKNTANQNLGQAGKYKSYVRVIMPEDAQNIQVSDMSIDVGTKINTDILILKGRKEIGFLIQVVNGEDKSILVNWSSPADLSQKSGEYRIYLRKQAGTPDDDRISLNITSSLTDEPSYVYNSSAGMDLFKTIHW